jgi:hypothetical protein|tara:strand:- start:77 stop:325 length:249 start_codon:yes stop_codon:yes gene_type:complete
VNGAALLLFFKSRKLFGAPPYKENALNYRFSSYYPAAGQWNLIFFSIFGSKDLVVDETNVLLGVVFLVLMLWPLTFLFVYFF